MKVTFILKGKNEPTNIVCRINPNKNIDLSTSTGIWVKRNDWNAKQQQLRQKANNPNKDLINSKLKELENFILDSWTADHLNKKDIQKNWLKNLVLSFFGKATENELYKIYFVDWAAKFINDAPKRLYQGRAISYRTIQKYTTTLNKIKAFETRTDQKLRFENINLTFYRDFVNYCKEVERLNNNSIGSLIKTFKMWCKNVELEGLPINLQYKHAEFATVSNETKDTYLSESEINRIFNFDLKENIRLSNAKDLFIIGLRTGLRVSDFMRVGVLNIKDEKIIIETQKTRKKVIIPMHPQVKAILESRGGVLPYAISSQKFNDYVKEICALVGINEVIEGAKMNPLTRRKEVGYFQKFELITSHTCRRSFATNLYGELPNKLIMAITGHTTETQFLKYIKTTNEQFAEILGDFWNSEKNAGKTPVKQNLKVI
ncbi:MAG: integrase [Flavobacterium sp. BFFFF2]|nr:MAG: integrase [Flavobacterium sp. BFFFF2]